MPFTPFKHLARVSLAKGITHAYAPSAVVTGQSIGPLHTHPATSKLGKTAHLQHVFAGPSSGGAGAGSRASQATSNGNGDGGLGQYYAAWQHAQQTGDDKEWKQHQTARRIGWKDSAKPSTTAASTTRPPHLRLDSIKAVDLLRPSSDLNRNPSSADAAVVQSSHPDATVDEAEALAKIDEAVSQEIKSIQAGSVEAIVISDKDAVHEFSTKAISEDEVSVEAEMQSPSTEITSPSVDESITLSETIVALGRQHRFTEIPQHFESMIKDGFVPTAEAYNQIIIAAINLGNGYQPFPRALEIYGDMTSRLVAANKETYATLITFLTNQSLEASHAQKRLIQQRLRYAVDNVDFILPSTQHQHDLYSGDASLQFATKFYNIAVNSLVDFKLRPSQLNKLLKAYALSGSAQLMRQLLADMKALRVPVTLEMYTTIIDACASVKDLETAKACYAEYRDRAMGRILEPMDIKVYVSLIRAYHTAGEAAKGVHFYQDVLKSFQGCADNEMLSTQVTDAFVVSGLVEHFVDISDYDSALASLSEYPLSDTARREALNKICVAAADNSNVATVEKIYTLLSPVDIRAECAMAVAAMHFRTGRLEEGKAAWIKTQNFANAATPDVTFATMYAMAMINAGRSEEGLSVARQMFRQIRSASVTSTQPNVTRILDEAISVLARHAIARQSTPPAVVSVLLFRLMIENGGLEARVTQDAIARLGPDCVRELAPQDLALALHVQSFILPSQPSAGNDVAHAARFAHFLETVIDRAIPMDPSTVQAVSDALPRLNGFRSDLERRWRDLTTPPPQTPVISQMASPAFPSSPVVDHVSSFDPYSNTTDHRASRVISDILESTTGRVETHIADAMSRLRNVRRIGRHLQYGAYAKLINATGRAKQHTLMGEILSMAQTDVPYDSRIPSVKAGWVQIYDSMVAACLTAGDRQLAAKYHQELLSMGAAPSANTFGIYITTLEGTFDEATEAVKIFQQAMSEGVTPSVFLFNAVIGKLGKARRIDDCLQYFGQMQNLGIRPSSVTYGTLVNALCRTSEETFAVEMFDEMEAATNYRPRPAPYNSIIQYFLNTKRDRSKVLQYYGRMRSKNIKPTSHTYKLLIESYATLEPVNLTAAETVLEDMKANGVRPESVHYGSLIHAKGCVMGDVTGARKIFDSVLADPTIKPTDNLYQNLLESMVANHNVSESDDIVADMKKRGIAMTPYIANTLIHGWAGKGDVGKARSIYDSLGATHREPSTYEAMTRAFLTVEDHESAKAVVSEMLSKGYPSAVADKVLALIGGNV